MSEAKPPRFADPARDPAVHLHTLRSDAGLVATVTNHGATLVGLEAPDRTGRRADVVLGFDTIEGYRSPANHYLGATIGRVANRIANGRFTLGGEEHQLTQNEPPHHLHGGTSRSFDKVLWEVVDADAAHVRLRYRSPDGEEGYPGDLEASATYALSGDALTITYEATTDRPTPVNMTNHAYLNLAGAGSGDVLDHVLQIDAQRYTPLDAGLIPTGEQAPVAGTPLDLREPRRLGDGIAAVRDQLGAGGYDHNLVLGATDGEMHETHGETHTAATLHDPGSGRTLELSTDQPCLQVYSGNDVSAIDGKGGARYERHAGLCLEPQHAPDSVNQPQWPSIVLAPGQVYRHRSTYRFSVS
ncbi:MAG: aldose epimerase family protein [Actinomycetota bacterium]